MASPPWLLACALQYIVWGRVGLLGALMWAATVGALQASAHRIGALIIMPSGRAIVAWLLWAQRLSAAPPRLLLRLRDGASWARVASGCGEALQQLRAAGHDDAARSGARAALLRMPGAEALALTSPDGVELDGVVLGRAAWAEGRLRGALLYLGGNAEFYETQGPLLARYAGAHALLAVALNVRGIGRSGARCGVTRDGAITDAATALAYLIHGCGVPPRAVVVLGHSIGGALGAAAAAVFPGVCLISDRSFGRLSDVALWALAEGASSASARDTAARAGVRALVRHVALWEIDAAEAWRARAGARGGGVIVAHAAGDEIIAAGASMAAALREAQGGYCELRMDDARAPHQHQQHNRPFHTHEEARIFEAVRGWREGAALPLQV